jgi:hypothetical protein
MNTWGIFNPSRIQVWSLSELDGFWAGQPRFWPPLFWGFELNDFCYRTILIVSMGRDRFYGREFGGLSNTDLLIERLEELHVRKLEL